MKKFISLLFIALISICFLCAESVSGPSSTMGEALKGEAYVDINLGIAPSEMYYYTFGFSNDSGAVELVQEGADKVPAAAEAKLKLDFNPKDSIASSTDPLYFWYKVRTNESFNFKIETAGELVDTKGSAGPLDWYVSFDRVDIPGSSKANPDKKNISSKAGNQSALLAVVPVENGDTYSAFRIGIKTDVIPFLSEVAEFTGTLKMSIAVK